MKATKVRSIGGLLCLLLLAVPASAANESGSGHPAPDWYLEHNEFFARDGGVFHTDNAAYRSEAEPWEGYGLAWEKGPSGLTLRGRLFGIRAGEEAGTFWEFFSYWHPEEGRAYMIQVGGHGVLGIGILEAPGADGTQRTEQTLHHPDGTTSRIAHEVRNHGDVHETRSFDLVDGEWEPRRSYVWHRMREAPADRAPGNDPP